MCITVHINTAKALAPAAVGQMKVFIHKLSVWMHFFVKAEKVCQLHMLSTVTFNIIYSFREVVLVGMGRRVIKTWLQQVKFIHFNV